jgi:hypothetical protein
VPIDAAKMDLPRFVKQGELNEKGMEARKELVAFLSALVRAILQSSYYTPDHPQSRRVVQAPWAMLHELAERHAEFTFIVASWREDATVALDGIFAEAVPLDDLILGATGEHFAKKMHGFCMRNRLVSFSIKNIIGEEEFHRFIGVFVEHHVNMEAQRLLDSYEEQKRHAPKFTEQLLESRVLNVSVVLEDDLLKNQRRLPWRVKVALARLRKDLRLVPLYAKASEEELGEVKLRILQDILRPLRRGTFLKQLFINLDLIAQEIEVLKDVELEADLLSALSIDRTLTLGDALLTEYRRKEQPALDDRRPLDVRPDLDEAILRLMRLVAEQFGGRKLTDKMLELLREFYEAKAVPLEELPRNMREQIRLDKWTASYLSDAHTFLKSLDEIANREIYMEQLPNLVAIFPNLLRIKRYNDANAIIALLERHRSEDGPLPGRTNLVVEALNSLDSEEVLRLLCVAMETEPPAVRASMRDLFSIMGVAAIRPLLRILENTVSPDVCNDVAISLITVGDDAREPLIKMLKGRHLAEHAAEYLLKVLGELAPTDDIARVLNTYTKHPRVAVREASYEAIFKLYKAKASTVLMRGLKDEEPDMVSRCIRFLSRAEVDDPVYVAQLLGFIQPKDARADAKEIPEVIQLAAIRALGEMKTPDLGAMGTLEDHLLATFDRSNQSRLMARLRRGRVTESDAVRIALCTALARVGGFESLDRLSDESHESSPKVIDRMRRAVRVLEERLEPAEDLEAVE